MKNLKIGTWNVQNSRFDQSKDDKKINSIINMLIFGDLDILALREVNPLMVNKIEERLKSLKGEYKITTSTKKYLNPISNLIVENNIIISRLKPISVSVDTKLASTPGFSLEKYNKRNLVAQMFDINGDKVIVNVTDLGEEDEKTRKNQFKQIIEEIDLEKVFIDEVILMGNFDSKQISDLDIGFFIKRLDDYGLKVIKNPIDNYCDDNSKEYKLDDYIIVPKSWDVEWNGTYAGSIVLIDKYFPAVASVTKKLR